MARCPVKICKRNSACGPGCPWFPYDQYNQEQRQEEILQRQDETLRLLREEAMTNQTTPEGWQLVPVEPTIEMTLACIHAWIAAPGNHDTERFPAAYRAMLTTAPRADDRITQEELRQLFGPEMPVEAAEYLFSAKTGPHLGMPAVRARLREIAAAPRTEPEGFQSVPVEPTEEIINALRVAWLKWRRTEGGDDVFRTMYRAMLAVAPRTEGGMEDKIKQLWQDILDKDDRTSPEEYPDMALITFEEFRDAMLQAAPRTGEVDRLWAALKPFAGIADLVNHTEQRDGEIVFQLRKPGGGYFILERDDFRRAAAALAEKKGEK